MGAYLIIEALEDIRNLIQNGLEIFRVSRNKLYAQNPPPIRIFSTNLFMKILFFELVGKLNSQSCCTFVPKVGRSSDYAVEIGVKPLATYMLNGLAQTCLVLGSTHFRPSQTSGQDHFIGKPRLDIG
ncbi:hypothetical protein JHK85_025682 [Glycine max]|nr:hypothetical protein JHK85_025682 [Glycine max]KAG5012923.1 hypothetical protein JHK86_025184 [Glycine max]